MATVGRVSGRSAPGPFPVRRLLGLGSVLALGLTMVAIAVAGLAGLDGRLAAKAPQQRTPAAVVEGPASNGSFERDHRGNRDCPARDS